MYLFYQYFCCVQSNFASIGAADRLLRCNIGGNCGRRALLGNCGIKEMRSNPYPHPKDSSSRADAWLCPQFVEEVKKWWSFKRRRPLSRLCIASHWVTIFTTQFVACTKGHRWVFGEGEVKSDRLCLSLRTKSHKLLQSRCTYLLTHKMNNIVDASRHLRGAFPLCHDVGEGGSLLSRSQINRTNCWKQWS